VPVVAWRIDGPADSGRNVPLTEYEDYDVEPGDIYALQHPNGSFHFADGERCTSETELLASFRKRV
jgi:hypothetical protein